MCVFSSTLIAKADVELPDRRYLYQEDKNRKYYEAVEKQKLKFKRDVIAVKSVTPEGAPLNVEASNLEYDTENDTIKANDDVLVTYSSTKMEGSSGIVNTETKDVELSGNVRVDDVDFDLLADSAKFNLENRTGTLQGVDLQFEQGDYRLRSREVEKFEGEVFEMRDLGFSTCVCPEGDDCLPWEIRANRARVEREGFGEAWDATLNVQDVPIFYFPYLTFPAKTQRQSGFLPFTFSAGGQNGFGVNAPFFWNIDDYTDATITPFYQSASRIGVDTEFRKVFSRQNNLEANLVFLDDSIRNGDLQGTNVDDLSDPTFDEKRFGGYIDHVWNTSIGGQTLQWILDAHFVSDDLFPREYQRDEIADFNSRFVTSTAVLRAPITSNTVVNLTAEFNQAIVDDDDLVFQRLPELELFSLNTFRPFGKNPFGLKLVSRSTLSSVNFSRTDSFDGIRNEAYQVLSVPFFFKNYFEGTLTTSARASHYTLQEDEIFGSATEEGGENLVLPNTSDRVVPAVNLTLGTVFEKVLKIPEDSLVKNILELGNRGRYNEISKIKHTIEPELEYLYVPSIDQSDTPQFDSTDRLVQKNVVTYGVTQRLYTRYEPRDTTTFGLEELNPEVEPVLPEGEEFIDRPAINSEVVEVARFELSQSLDILEKRDDLDPNLDEFSDLAAKLVLLPNDFFGVSLSSNYNFDDQDFSSYALEGQFRSKRGDRLLSRLRFIDSQVRQLETNLEIKVTDNTRFGYYSRYDDLNSQFLEQRAGLRFSSDCDCWNFDISVSDRVNPDQTQFEITVTLLGLGELGNTFGNTRN